MLLPILVYIGLINEIKSNQVLTVRCDACIVNNIIDPCISGEDVWGRPIVTPGRGGTFYSIVNITKKGKFVTKIYSARYGKPPQILKAGDHYVVIINWKDSTYHCFVKQLIIVDSKNDYEHSNREKLELLP